MLKNYKKKITNMILSNHESIANFAEFCKYLIIDEKVIWYDKEPFKFIDASIYKGDKDFNFDVCNPFNVYHLNNFDDATLVFGNMAISVDGSQRVKIYVKPNHVNWMYAHIYGFCHNMDEYLVFKTTMFNDVSEEYKNNSCDKELYLFLKMIFNNLSKYEKNKRA